MNKRLYILFWAIVTITTSKVAFGQEAFSLLTVDDKPALSIKGFVEIDTTTSTYPHQEIRNIFKKDEMKINTTIKYGKDTLYAYADTNAYLLPNLINKNMNPDYTYASKSEIWRNGTITSTNAEINFRECFINWEIGSVRLRAGNQIIAWGTADVFNPTSYFNPYDLREFLFKDQDTELTMGIPAISGLYTAGNNSVEAVVTPVQVPSRLPVSGTFWELAVKEGPFPVIIDDTQTLSFDYSNIGIGLKYYHSIVGYDVHISGYHGPDKEPYMLPIKTVIEPNKPVSILVQPQYAIVDMIGLALSKSFDKFVIQLEGAYSPNKTGVVDTNLKALTPQSLLSLLPYQTKQSHFVSYSVGFNYFLPIRDYFKDHEGECVFTLEWNNSHYFNHTLMKPMLSDIIVFQLRDSYINNKLKASINGILERQTHSFTVMPKVSYRFDSGLYCELQYIYIRMDMNSYFACYDANDSVQGRIRYEF